MNGQNRGGWVLPVAFGVIGALVGLVIALLGAGSPVFQEPSGQELTYAATARNLASPRPVEPTTTVVGPAYPRLLALFSSFNSGFGGARRVQLLLLGFLVPLLTVLAARRHFGGRVALLAGALTLLLGGFWVQAVTFVPYAWQAVFALLMLLVMPAGGWPAGRPEDHGDGHREQMAGGPGSGPGILPLFAIGALAGVARLFGGAWAPAFVVVLAVLAIVRRWGLAAAGGAVAAFLAIVLVGSALRLDPVPGGAPLLGGGGVETVLGWHDGARGVEPRRAERAPWRWFTGRDVFLELERAQEKQLSPAEASHRAYARTAGWIASHPAEAALLALRKAGLFLSGVEFASPDSPRFRARETLPGRGLLLWLSIPIFALGLAGLAAGAVRRGETQRKDGAVHAERGGGAVRVLLIALLVGSVLTAVGGLARPGDRLSLLLALTGPAAFAALNLGRLGARGFAALGLGLALGAWTALAEAPRLESAAEDHFQMGSVYERLRRPSEASTEYDRALAADPGHVPSQLSRAGGLARDGVFDAAIGTVEDVVGRAPHITPAWNLLARLYQNQRRFAEAASAYEKLVELDPYNFEAWNNLGTMHATLGHYDQSVAALRRSLEIEPNYRSAFVNLTEIEKRGPEGLAGAQPVTPGATGSADQLQQGVAAVMQRIQADDVAGAEELIARLHETYAGSPYIDFASGTLALHKKEYRQALELYERARSGLPNEVALIFNIGMAWAGLGDTEKAAAAMREVLALDPGNQPAQQMLQQLGAEGQ